jgi:hypothetical protein
MKARLLATSPFFAVAVAALALIAPGPPAPACHQDHGTWLCDIPPAKVGTHAPLLRVGRQAVQEKQERGPDNQPLRLAEPRIVHPPVGVGHSSRVVLANNHFGRDLNESHRRMVAARLATMRRGERTDTSEPSATLRKADQEDRIAAVAEAGYAGKPWTWPAPYGDPLPSYANERERLDPWHGYDTRDGPENGY